MALSSIIANSIIGLLLFAFLLFAWRDLLMLVRHPAKGMGTGLSRAWAVGHTTMIESWTARVWLLPIIWLIISVLLILVVRPYDESDRFPLYIRILLTAQEWLLLIMLGILGCVSLPRERERKIIITNASKPLSRLEILLGKIFGFSIVAAILLVVMGFGSWAVLHVADYKIRAEAAKAYQLAEDDYRQKSGTQQAIPPPEDKRRLAEEGSLFAYNYITVPPQNMSIVGGFSNVTGNRLLKGGSLEKVTYRFTPRISAPTAALVSAVGSPVHPFFEFSFPVSYYVSDHPKRILIEVSAARSSPHLLPSEAVGKQKTIALDATGHGYWEVDNPADLFTAQDDPSKEPAGDVDLGPVEVSISCSTPGVFLEIKDGGSIDPKSFSPTDWNVLAAVSFGNDNAYTPPEQHPVMLGFERHDMQEISGPDKRELREYGTAPVEFAIFRFPAKDLKDIPVDSDGNFALSMSLDTDKTDNYGRDTEGKITAYNENARGQEITIPPFSVIEKRVTQVKLPDSLLGGPDPAKRGDLVVILSCQTPGHSIALGQNSLRIDQPQSSFLLNIFKSETVIFCEVALLIVICVTWSVRLGWPVATLAALTCALFGFIAEFVASLPSSGGLAALGYSNYGTKTGIEKFFDSFSQGIWQMLNFVRSLIPDYTRYDPLQFIAELRNMPWPALGSDLLWTLAYAIPFIALGYMLFRKQELG